MGQKKKKDKQKRKKKQEKQKDRSKQRKKDKKRSYSSSSDSSSDSSSYSSSSSDRSRQKRKKQKSNKQKAKQKKPSKTQTKTVVNPYDFQGNTIMFPPVIPGIKAPMISMPPPAPVTTSNPVVVKSKTKQINIFKLLPKLPYGPVLFAKTLYSTDFISEELYCDMMKQMTLSLQKKVKQQGHKKGINCMTKCLTQLQKLKVEKTSDENNLIDKSLIQAKGQNRYQNIRLKLEKLTTFF